MAEFKAFKKNIEVNGKTILSVLSGMKGFEKSAKGILAKNGINNPEPDKWYSQQAWLDAFKEISVKIGEKTLISIGQTIPENAEWPPDIKTIESVMASIDIAYHMNHRYNETPLFDPETGKMSEGIGHYNYKKTGDREITMVCENPYPCALDRGIIKAVAKKFMPANSKLDCKEVVFEGCRSKGANKCTYVVSW